MARSIALILMIEATPVREKHQLLCLHPPLRMGVSGLWELLKPAGKSQSLLNLATNEGFMVDKRQLRTLIMPASRSTQETKLPHYRHSFSNFVTPIMSSTCQKIPITTESHHVGDQIGMVESKRGPLDSICRFGMNAEQSAYIINPMQHPNFSTTFLDDICLIWDGWEQHFSEPLDFGLWTTFVDNICGFGADEFPVAKLYKIVFYNFQPIKGAGSLADLSNTSTAPLASLNDFSPDPVESSTAANLERVQNALQRANLVLTVDVAVTGPIFDTIDTAFENHCERYNIQYVIANPPEAVKTPNTASWVLLGPQGRPEVLESPPIDCLFDPPNLRPEHVLIHRCFARRVLHPIIVSLSGDPEPESLGSSPHPDVFVASDSDEEELDVFLDNENRSHPWEGGGEGLSTSWRQSAADPRLAESVELGQAGPTFRTVPKPLLDSISEKKLAAVYRI
ncbi:hypothetical protein B0H14DRAFT_3711065 [Mycena olivaceomarginata]|nr:hypothetical protein B0H14DRAFT_3711065 [Mycena olivaceomarginata]